jgi:hypothetical protein
MLKAFDAATALTGLLDVPARKQSLEMKTKVTTRQLNSSARCKSGSGPAPRQMSRLSVAGEKAVTTTCRPWMHPAPAQPGGAMGEPQDLGGMPAAGFAAGQEKDRCLELFAAQRLGSLLPLSNNRQRIRLFNCGHWRNNRHRKFSSRSSTILSPRLSRSALALLFVWKWSLARAGLKFGRPRDQQGCRFLHGDRVFAAAASRAAAR